MTKFFRVNNLREWDFALDSLYRKGYRWLNGTSLSEEKHHEYFLEEGRNYISFDTDKDVGASLLISDDPRIVSNPFKIVEEIE